MSKPTLGRGLGDLLGPDRAPQKPDAPVRPPGVGLRILIGGAPREAEDVRDTRPGAAPATREQIILKSESRYEALTRSIVIVALISADISLLGWSTHFVIAHRRALELSGIALCTGSTLLAALCGCAAMLSTRRREHPDVPNQQSRSGQAQAELH